MRKIILFVLALVAVAAVWEFYKWVGPDDGGDVFGWQILPKTADYAMPHVWTMGGRLFDPESRASGTPNWRVVLAARVVLVPPGPRSAWPSARSSAWRSRC